MANKEVLLERLGGTYYGKLGACPNGSELIGLHNFYLSWSKDILGNEVSNIEFITTFSLRVMPCIIRDHSSSINYLVWDNHFWHLYGLFLLSVSKYCSVADADAHIAVDKELKSILLLYLSCRFDEMPSLARYIAEEYALLEPSSFAYNRPCWLSDELLFSGNGDAYSIGCMFGLCHEIAHVAFREDTCFASRVKKILVNFCESQLELFQLDEEINRELNSEGDISPTLKKSIQRLLNAQGTHFFEEICCDIIAILTLVKSFTMQGYSKKAVVNLVGKLELFFCFDWWRASNEKMWKMFADVFMNPTQNDCAFVDEKHRYYRYGASITEELLFRMNIPFACVSAIIGVDLRNNATIEERDKYLAVVDKVNCYELVEKVMIHFQRSKKDLLSQIKHRERRNKLIGWRVSNGIPSV